MSWTNFFTGDNKTQLLGFSTALNQASKASTGKWVAYDGRQYICMSDRSRKISLDQILATGRSCLETAEKVPLALIEINQKVRKGPLDNDFLLQATSLKGHAKMLGNLAVGLRKQADRVHEHSLQSWFTRLLMFFGWKPKKINELHQLSEKAAQLEQTYSDLAGQMTEQAHALLHVDNISGPAQESVRDFGKSHRKKKHVQRDNPSRRAPADTHSSTLAGRVHRHEGVEEAGESQPSEDRILFEGDLMRSIYKMKQFDIEFTRFLDDHEIIRMCSHYADKVKRFEDHMSAKAIVADIFTIMKAGGASENDLKIVRQWHQHPHQDPPAPRIR